MNTRALTLTKVEAWAIHDCLQAALAGFGGRHETSEPWHGTNLMDKLRPVLLRFEEPSGAFTPADGPPAQSIELTEGELKCIDLNVPRTAFQGAAALLLRVYRVMEEISYNLPLLGEEPAPEGLTSRLRAWQDRERESPQP